VNQRAGVVATLLLVTTVTRADDEMLGPLRVRDMTPFNLLRLDMLPAHAVTAGPGSFALEVDLSLSNTFVMSENVRTYIEGRQGRRALTQGDVDAILSMGGDAYHVDGEFDLLELTAHYWITRRTSVYATVSAYDFTGGFLDGGIEGFHQAFNLPNADRDRMQRDRFQMVLALNGARLSFLDAPVDHGLGDPVIGVRHDFPLGDSPWTLVVSGEAKLAWQGARLFLSTGTNDYGLQMALQGKFRRQGVYFSGSLVRTDGQVFGVQLAPRVVPTIVTAYEVALTKRTSFIGQIYVSQSTVRDSQIDEIRADKYQVSVGFRSHRAGLSYGFALTENVENFENTPDVGVTFSLSWLTPGVKKGDKP
jgi:hypothetical protein